MPVNITDSNTFTDPVQAPDDGDNANGATFQLAPQALANRTRNLKNRLDAADADIADLQTDKANLAGTNTFSGDQTAPNWLHATPKTQTRLRRALSAFSRNTSEWTEGALFFTAIANTASLLVSITDLLEPGAEIDEISVRVKPGSARSGGNLMVARLRHLDSSGSLPTDVDSGTDDGTTNEQSITMASVGHTVLSNRDYYIEVVSGNDASSNNDRWYGVSVVQKFSKAGLQT